MSKVQITKRYIDILGWINGLGFVNINHVAERYRISTVTAYARLRKLVQCRLLQHERLVHNEPGLYRVTREGSDLSPISLPPIRQVALATYKHTQRITELSLKLAAHYSAQFIPERILRSELVHDGVGYRGHLSDGVLLLDDKKIAIEVELTTKSKWRLQKIFHHYLRSFEYDEVWYFCSSQAVMNLIESVAKKYSLVKVFLLRDWVENTV